MPCKRLLTRSGPERTLTMDMSQKPHERAVYLLSLELQNVRCFGEKQVLNLCLTPDRPSAWTLLLGNNGVGKTTLLQCLSWMRPVPRFGKSGKVVGVQPALTDEDNPVLSTLLRNGKGVVLTLQAKFVAGGTLPGETQDPRSRIKTGIQLEGSDNKLQEQSPLVNTNRLTPEPMILAYGANRPMGLANLDSSDVSDQSVTLIPDSTELYDATEILERLDYAAARQNPNASTLLKTLKHALAAILPDVKTADDIHLHGPDLGSPGQKSGVEFRTQYGNVPLSALSLGYRTVAALALDIAWRLISRHPRSTSPLAQPAIVLIDEIDLHLHPRWQRQIMAILSHHFPGVQFIATAHSPMMVDASPHTNLAVLSESDGQVRIENEPQVVEGWRVDQILTSELFGLETARSPRIEALLTERRLLLRKSRRTPADKSRLSEVDVELSDLPTAERQEDQEAMDMIRRAAAMVRGQAGKN